MKKFLSLALALVMSMTLSVSAFAANEPPVDPTPEEGWVMPRMTIYNNTMYSSDSTWVSPYFTANPGNGNYISYQFQNTGNEAVKVYFYITINFLFGSVDWPLWPITVPANSSQHNTFHSSKACTGQYKIVIESNAFGDAISGTLSVTQYLSDPN